LRAPLLGLVPSSFVRAYGEAEAFLFLPKHRSEAPLVVLVGHYDTVPAQGNHPGRIADGAVHGLGASDMKGGVAVAIEIVRDLAADRAGPYDVGLLLFGREELSVEHDPLPALFARCEPVHESSLAIVLEPTVGQIHAGCLGNLIAELVFHGTSGHSARPWLADNAIAWAEQAWTNVADFPARGLDAVSFGPGDPAFAHRRDEKVEIAALVHAYETLVKFLTTAIDDDER